LTITMSLKCLCRLATKCRSDWRHWDRIIRSTDEQARLSVKESLPW
jgi:hypothetical protein